MPPTPKTSAAISAAFTPPFPGGGHWQRAEALQELNTELEHVLTGSGGATTEGRSAMAELLAEVDTALTALGPVADTPTGRGLVADTLTDALDRAGAVVGQSRSAAANAAARVDELAQRYLRQANATAQPLRGSTRPPQPSPTGTTAAWIDQALGILAGEGLDTSRIDPADVAAIIAHESAGDPHAINLWDNNAAAGNPSKGLMQMIDTTFYAHCAPGHTDIWNPVDNIVAGVRYAVARYGAVASVPGVLRLHEGLSYVSY
jgi:soluble lytic murein transglycosylase-like protein